MATTTSAGNTIVKEELLNKENYKEWIIRMKSYLLAEDLWDVIKPFKSESDKSSEISVWKEKNAKALDAILRSCGTEAKNLILDCSSVEDSARNAWNKLARAYNSDSKTCGYDPPYQLLYEAIQIGDLETTKQFLNDYPEAMTAKISSDDQIALHVAAAFKHVHIVKELVKLMSEEDLELTDIYAHSALMWASIVGITEMARCMVSKSKKMLTIPCGGNNFLPVTQAVVLRNKEIAEYLYSNTPPEALSPENGPYGILLIRECLSVKYLDMVLDLLKGNPQLATTSKGGVDAFVRKLATEHSIFPSGSQLQFFHKWIYNWIKIEPVDVVNEVCIDVQHSNTASASKINLMPGLMDRVASTFLDLLGIKQISETKLFHKQSQEILRITCDQIKALNYETLRNHGLFQSIIEAARHGIHEFITELIKAKPILAWSCWGEDRNLFYSAIKYRQAEVFNLIYGFIWKDQATNTLNEKDFTMLHMAGMLAPQGQISGAALQMQRELQWFKEVESILPPGRIKMKNKEGLTARELFSKEHKDLVKEGEKWMKETATSCTVVGALIVTIMFAAAFTVPGGNDQVTGYPMFKDKSSFMFFIISDAVSLFSSSTSVLMFLGILTSRYAEDDFLKSLPTKLIIGLSLLFISIASMMATFCASLFIMLEGKSWIIEPVILLASVPIGLFIKLQFPLLIEIFISTFGPGIFDRNVKHWL